jgi:hypothetical protein
LFQDNEKNHNENVNRQSDVTPDDQAMLNAFHATGELDCKESKKEYQKDSEAVKQSVYNKGRKYRTRADTFLFPQNKGPDEFAQPGWQNVIRHVTDYGCGEEVAKPRLFQRQKEITPANRPEKITDKGGQNRRPQIITIHLFESGQQFMDINLPEQQKKKEKTYPDPDPEFFIMGLFRHSILFPDIHGIR